MIFSFGCASRDPSVDLWRKSTITRLKSSVFYVLEQAGYIEDTKTMRLQTVYIAREVVRYPEAHNEDNVLRCIQIASQTSQLVKRLNEILPKITSPEFPSVSRK